MPKGSRLYIVAGVAPGPLSTITHLRQPPRRAMVALAVLGHRLSLSNSPSGETRAALFLRALTASTIIAHNAHTGQRAEPVAANDAVSRQSPAARHPA